MTSDPKKPAEPGSPENLGLTKKDAPEKHDDDAKRIEEKGEPFDDNFA
ncbi:hypothetical protein [Sphingomonas solaris]|nr:hypothetical protein [Sphingomonas solaris]